MDFGRSFSYITEDEDWIKKILIASVLLLTGIGGIVVAGWFAEIVKRVANDDANPLPDWSDFGGYAVEGLKIIGLALVWSLPIILLLVCNFAITFGGASLASGDAAEVMTTVVLISSICVYALVFVYSILLALVLPASISILATGGTFGDALKKAFPTFRANIGGFLIAAIAGTLVVSILSTVGVILCVIGTYLGMAFGYAIQGHLYGQAYKAAQAALPAG